MILSTSDVPSWSNVSSFMVKNKKFNIKLAKCIFLFFLNPAEEKKN